MGKKNNVQDTQRDWLTDKQKICINRRGLKKIIDKIIDMRKKWIVGETNKERSCYLFKDKYVRHEIHQYSTTTYRYLF